MEKLNQSLLDALKQALTEPGEQRLFRAGKLPGLLAGRAGVHADAAVQALRDGLLEVTRTETKGKTTTEWVRATSRAVEFVHQHESPVQAVRDLKAVLEMTQEGIPVWMGQLRKELEALGDRLTEQAQRITNHIDALSQRVTETLQRAEVNGLRAPQDVAAIVAWGPLALDFVNKRKGTGVVNHCALPELFAALRDKQPELSITDFHAGLRRLHDRGILRLLPYDGQNALAEPEYALLDGATTYYHVVH